MNKVIDHTEENVEMTVSNKQFLAADAHKAKKPAAKEEVHDPRPM